MRAVHAVLEPDAIKVDGFRRALRVIGDAFVKDEAAYQFDITETERGDSLHIYVATGSEAEITKLLGHAKADGKSPKKN